MHALLLIHMIYANYMTLGLVTTYSLLMPPTPPLTRCLWLKGWASCLQVSVSWPIFKCILGSREWYKITLDKCDLMTSNDAVWGEFILVGLFLGFNRQVTPILTIVISWNKSSSKIFKILWPDNHLTAIPTFHSQIATVNCRGWMHPAIDCNGCHTILAILARAFWNCGCPKTFCANCQTLGLQALSVHFNSFHHICIHAWSFTPLCWLIVLKCAD